MKFRMLSSSVVLCLLMMVASVQPGRAQLEPLPQPEPEWLTQMLQEGWQKVAEGLLQRSGEGGQIETFTYGAEGLQWMVQRLEQQISSLVDLYNTDPSEELADVISRLTGDLAEAENRLSTGQVGEPLGGEQLNNCDTSFGAHAYADPLTGSGAPGVKAQADAYFHSSCFLGNTYAYVYVQAQTGSVFSTKTQEDPRYNGNWHDSAAQWSLSGSLNCHSHAYARTWSPALGFSYETQDNNYDCPVPPAPLVVTVSGPTNVFTDYYYTPCETVTWSASISGGTPSYSGYDWYINNVYQSTGSTLSRTYCGTNQTVNVKAIGYDSASQSAQGTFTTYVYYEPEPYDPCMYGGCGNCGLNDRFCQYPYIEP